VPPAFVLQTMRLRVLRSLWGVVKQADGPRSLEDALPLIKRLGYDGVEVPYKLALQVGIERFGALLNAHDLDVSFIFFTDGPVAPGFPEPIVNGGPYGAHPAPALPGAPLDAALVDAHVGAFAAQLRGAYDDAPPSLRGRVVSCNSHSGSDRFTAAMSEEFFGRVLELEAGAGRGPVFHETHRTRILYSPWVARDLLPRVGPALKLTADLSHWTNVAEVGPDNADLEAVVRQVAPQCHEIHGRVGFEEGPQVADPRAPEWLASHTEGFERLWDVVWEAAAAAGHTVTTFVPEHGPGLYQPSLPGLGGELGERWPAPGFPLADIWDVNHWVALRARARFEAGGARFGGEAGGGTGGTGGGGVVESATQGLGTETSGAAIFLEDWQADAHHSWMAPHGRGGAGRVQLERESVTVTLARNFALRESDQQDGAVGAGGGGIGGGGGGGGGGLESAPSASERALAGLGEHRDDDDYDGAEQALRRGGGHHDVLYEKWRLEVEDAADDVLYVSQRAKDYAEEALDLSLEADDKGALGLAQEAQSLAEESEELALSAQDMLQEALDMAEEAQALVEEAQDKAHEAQNLAEDAQLRAEQG
jgi:sugar phosphate isomerase/epimerase